MIQLAPGAVNAPALDPVLPEDGRGRTVKPYVIGIAACAAALVLHGYPIVHPFLFDDDFALVRDSWTWSDTVQNLWRPWNEHAMPLGRLSTWLLVQIADEPTQLPLVAALQGPLAVLAGMCLVYIFVRRELGHPLYGLTAMILFGVTLKYNEAVRWFAASFALLALDTTLLALLAAQRWRRTGRAFDGVLCVMWCALAPGWFAVGVLAGPLCCIYLFSRRRFVWLAPLIGTMAFTTVSLSQNYHAIHHAEHFQGRTAAEAFQPLLGVLLTARIMVDNLVLGFRTFGATAPIPLVVGLCVFLALTAMWWGRRGVRVGVRPQLIWLSAALLVLPYLLAFSFRAAWPYEQMMVGWTRYNLFPFLGLVWLVCAGLPSRQGTLFQLNHAGLTRRQCVGLLAVIGLLLLLQLPSSLVGGHVRDGAQSEQMACLRRIAAVDRRCRELGISAHDARGALGTLVIPYSGDPSPRINGWELLRGSQSPRPISAADARSLLLP